MAIVESGNCGEVQTRFNVWTVCKKKWPLYRGGGCGEVAISRLVQQCYIHLIFFTWISLLSKLPDETENMKHISLNGAKKILEYCFHIHTRYL